jgi:hypothetical protein
LSIRFRQKLRGELDGSDGLVLAMTLIYIIAGLAFFDHIKMWMGGDAVAHASNCSRPITPT